jgi:CDP-diacylglycerol pyrophosphatase
LVISLAGGLIALVLTASAHAAFAPERHALWPVVRACVADFKLTGAPFPCLEVDLTGGEERGYVVLRPPIGSPDTILAPTRKITGVEDAFLQSPAAPNYFDAARRARSFLNGADGTQPEPDRIALVVNPAVVRGQDQLHIHVGCFVPQAASALRRFAPTLEIGEWTTVGPLIPHQPFWALRTGATDLKDIDPFRLAAAGLADKIRSRRDLIIAVANARIDDHNEFVILASYVGVPHGWWPAGAEDLLDSACSTKPRLSGLK